MPVPDPPREICIGRVLRASGLAGEVRLQFFRPRRRRAPGDPAEVPVLVLEGADGARARFEVERVRWVDPVSAAVKLRGVGDRTTAEGLRGRSVLIDLDRPPALLTDEADPLVGGAAFDAETRALLGTITGLHDNGAQALLVLGSGAEERLVPFVDAFIAGVERGADGRRAVFIRVIPGLLDG